ncbi:hypothetical protein I3843_05G027200 [Carya illinoinensis]|uniref:Uncharacterized protein n=1 Tax=Carya illinoinensis TaxID=32201 RepID=A0A922JNF9_CARIL|nr:hypothetical protein I3842_05G028200 [Carya illinoinensis]KAG7977339.1 hypothetical protein I3843_05G027200 [Carya illinoinensis]
MMSFLKEFTAYYRDRPPFSRSSSRVVVGFSSREFSLGFVRRCWPKSVFCGVGIFIPQRYIKTNLILQNTSTF